MQFRIRQDLLLLVSATAAIASGTEATRSVTNLAITKTLASNADRFLENRENVHRLLAAIRNDPPQLQFLSQSQSHAQTSFTTPSFVRRLEQDDYTSDNCDAAFVRCLPNAKCTNCFESMTLGSIDWAGVTPGVKCEEVITFLSDAGLCTSLNGDKIATSVFCRTFNACVIWDDDDDDDTAYLDDDATNKIDCASLTECQWDGIHKGWIGDGVCHDNMEGCYNTEICGYDGGDCCEDTCKITDVSSYMDCGHDGYACKDPGSDNCRSDLTTKCPSTANGKGSGKSGDKPEPAQTKCEADEAKYRLIMYDSFGDGWDTTTLTIQPDGSSDVLFKGGLVDGFEGTEYVCLSKAPQCYNVQAQGGTWGVEVAWEVKPMGDGAPSIAGGGAPGDCDFSVAGEVCPKTCDGKKPDADPTKDPDYKTFKELYSCIEEKCVIQLGACNADPSCKECFSQDAPDYCYGIDTFVSIIDCTMCSCTDKAESEFCAQKSGPGQVTPPEPKDNEDKKVINECTPKQTIIGTSAIMDYSSCTNLDSVSLLISDFDQNNFGQLDSFETCAHSYEDEDNHGGRTALSCMQILKNAITNPTVDDKKKAPKAAISALATNLYDHGDTFCNCSKKASDKCPLCPSFMNFKSILYESIDACQSLDAIDCDAWDEFWKPCKDNLESEFGNSELTETIQCEYMKNDCGNAGPFPAFRRLDCIYEIEEDAWDFYKKFSKNCLKGSDGIPPSQPPSPTPAPLPTPDAPKPNPKPAPKPAPKPVPVPVPVPTPSDPGTKPTPKPYVPADDDNAQPYKPKDDDSEGDKNSKSSSHWFRNLVVLCALGGVGYVVYKKRFDGFNFVQYRRRVFGGRGSAGLGYGMVDSSGYGESEMYGNLNSSTTFEPPSLPPTPQMMNPYP